MPTAWAPWPEKRRASFLGIFPFNLARSGRRMRTLFLIDYLGEQSLSQAVVVQNCAAASPASFERLESVPKSRLKVRKCLSQLCLLEIVLGMHTRQCRSTRFALCGALVALVVALPLAAANAKWIEKPSPLLPYGVYVDGLQGSVVLSLTMDRSGHVVDSRVLRGSGSPTLDGLARDAAAKWRLSQNSVVATDLTQGRVEKVIFVHGPPQVKTLPPNSLPFWASR